jgi:hypothetical protein
VSREQASGADARLLLTGKNAWLMDEIGTVSASGRSKTLLDADVRTVRGDTISANLSIVPLMADGPAAVMRERARILAKHPPAADWDGVWNGAATGG